MMGKVEVAGGAIRIDGVATQIISGTIHYFRHLPEQWRDRIIKAKMMGLNAIETYVCHNLHEPHPGQFDFSGMLDLERFLEIIQEEGLYAIVRPGSYICAEWENGGLPAWMTAAPGPVRCSAPAFLEATDRYLDELLPRLRRFQYTEGGPVILMQIENEYGSYGRDKAYLAHLRDRFRRNGIEIPLFTSDGPCDWMLQGGTLEGCLQTVNFGSRSEEAFAKGREYQPEGPDFCMEFWNGWFDHWGEEHHVRAADEVAAELDSMLKRGANVNFFVFSGGTNFGFTAGANGNGETPDDYAPTVTSYDYDGPISECGDPTPKFFACREVIRKYRPDAPFGTPAAARKSAFGFVKFEESAPLLGQLDRLAGRRRFLTAPTMEECGQNFGFICYRTRLTGPFESTLYFPQVRDRAMAFLDGRCLGTVYRNDAERKLPLEVPATGGVLEILVENTGRINYGPQFGRDPKGLPGGVCIGWQMLTGFDVWNLELNNIGCLAYAPFEEAQDRPAFHRGYFDVAEPADTFVRFPGVKGVVWINGFNLGRYWNIGPGETLYVPAPLLKPGRNEIVVLELHRLNAPGVELVDKMNLG